MPRITVVNDNPAFLELVREILEDDRYETTTVDVDTSDTLDRIVASRPDLLMIDLRLGDEGFQGWDIARRLRAQSDFERMPVLVCSADVQALNEIESDIAASPSVGVLTKPFGIEELIEAIDRLLEPVGG